jgi:2-C-methyl-D-erythritol 4-phosphate cytidylyltransferase
MISEGLIMNVAIILAGGVGSRVGANIPKQFIPVFGKPILAYSLEIFQNDEKIDFIEIVSHKKWISETSRIVQKYGISKAKWIVEGGSTFQESTINGIFSLQNKLVSDDVVTISFGVSPMTSQDIIDDSIAVCLKRGNGIASEDMVLCTCLKDDEFSSSHGILRETIKGFSNPWTFHYGDLLSTYQTAQKDGILNKIDPHTTSLYLYYGKKLFFSKSNSWNMKITTKEDIEIFKGYLLLKGENKHDHQ